MALDFQRKQTLPHGSRRWLARITAAAWLGVCPLSACAAQAATNPAPSPAGPMIVAASDDPAPPPKPAPVRTRPESTRLTEDQQRDLQLLLGVLGDSKIDLAKRRAAAAGLLSRGWPAAIQSLDDQLSDSTDPAGQRAVAGALGASTTTSPPPALAQPLLELIGVDNEALRSDVATALGRYDDGPVMTQLIDWAKDAKQPLNVRTGAIAVLAEQRQPESAATLVSLTTHRHDRAVRTAAFSALEELTGNTEIGRDSSGWHKWWHEQSKLPRDRWLAQLVRSLSEQKRQLVADQATLTGRLADVYSQLYVATAEADRPTLLIKMLDDPIVSVRLAALRLVERNLLNAQSPSQPVREKLRTRLNDDSPLVRASAAALLRDIDDDAAADDVAGRLLSESDPTVQNAYLSLLARKPRASAIDPALVLLGHGETRAAAASTLQSAFDANMLQPAQQATALKLCREAIKHNDAPDAPVVKLFGRLMSDSDAADRALIEGLLDDADAVVRRAAAEAYVSGPLDIAPLMGKLDDAALAGRALEAASRKGGTLDLAVLLLNHPPKAAELVPAWRSALAAIAGRLDAVNLQQLDDALIARKQPADLRVAVLAPAMQLKQTSPQRTDLLLRLTRLQLDANQLDPAKATMQAIGDENLTADQQARRDRGQLELLLKSGQYDDAVALAGQLGTTKGEAAAADVGKLLMDAADSAITAKHTEQAGQLLATAGKLLAASKDAALQARLKALREKLAAAQQTPAPLPPAPSPAPTPSPAPAPAPAPAGNGNTPG